MTDTSKSNAKPKKTAPSIVAMKDLPAGDGASPAVKRPAKSPAAKSAAKSTTAAKSPASASKPVKTAASKPATSAGKSTARPAAKPAPTTTESPAPTDSATAPTQASQSGVSPEERNDKIREAAYRRFQERGQSHGDDVRDWLDAEREVDRG